jgi:hypothetical protein
VPHSLVQARELPLTCTLDINACLPVLADKNSHRVLPLVRGENALRVFEPMLLLRAPEVTRVTHSRDDECNGNCSIMCQDFVEGSVIVTNYRLIFQVRRAL